eukprot:s109_g14.t1
MAAGGSQPYFKDDEIVVDRDGIPHYTGMIPGLMREYRQRRVLFAYNNLEVDGKDEAEEQRDLLKRRQRFAKKLLDALHGEALKACEELMALQAIEKVSIVKRTEAFDRFFDAMNRRRGQPVDGYIRQRKQQWNELQDLAEGVQMSIRADVPGCGSSLLSLEMFQSVRHLFEDHFKFSSALRDGTQSENLELEEPGLGRCEQQGQLRQQLLNLGFTGVEGNLCNWPGITCYEDSETMNCTVKELECATCAGHLPDFMDLRLLRAVRLTSPKLTGDIKAFSGTPRLWYLDLHGTQVSGDISSLSELFSMDSLDLSGTKVTGRLEDLLGVHNESWRSRMSHLYSLQLSHTEITGELSALVKSHRLTKADLSFTKVSGRLDSNWLGRCGNLHTLQLQNSSVQFVPKGEELVRVKERTLTSVLSGLKDLDLTNCPVNSFWEDFLVPFVMSSVISIRAVGAGITGPIQKLTNVEARRLTGAYVSNFTYPLAKSLVMLDLSRNNITELLDLPVQPNVGRILLRENHELVVTPQVLTEALNQQIILDLSGTALKNQEEVPQLLEEGRVGTTDMYAERNDTAGYACKDLVDTVRVTPAKFLPQTLCKCLPGWHGHGATCQMCPADKFSDDMGVDICKSCPANSSAPEGSTKLADCKCKFGDLHNGTCSCDKHQTLRDGNCILCSKLHLQCATAGIRASIALPDVHYARLEPQAEEARRCLPPDVSRRCPGSHQCGLGYDGTLCATCANGFWPKGGRCQPCAQANQICYWSIAVLGVAAVLIAVFLAYRRVQQVPQSANVRSQLKQLLVLQAPGLLQMVQLWTVLSHLGGPRESGTSRLPEAPYLEVFHLTINDLQSSLNLQCSFNAATVRTLAALGSPLLPLLLLACSAALEFSRSGLGVNVSLKLLPFLFIGGACSTAELLSCQLQDGDGESLGDFAFRKALPHLRCYDRNGAGFWSDMVGYSSALAYGVLIPLFLAGLMVRQRLAKMHVALQPARLFCAYAEGEGQITLRLQPLEGKLLAQPKRLLAAAAAYMAVNCGGERREIRLHDGYIATTSSDVAETPELRVMKVVDAETSRNSNVLLVSDGLRTRRLTKMLTERIMLDEAEDRLLIGSQSLLSKYTLSQEGASRIPRI